MEKDAPEATCRFCHTYNRLDRVFCLRCNRRIQPPSPLCLTPDDFTCPGDRSNLDALKGTEPIPFVVRKLVSPGGYRSEAWLAKNAARIGPPSRLDGLIRACGEILGLDVLPKVYVAPVGEVNAFAAGVDDSPFLVIGSATLDKLDFMDVEGIVAHELAHVRSRHVLYHTLAESLATGVRFVAPLFGAGLLAYPIRMLLLSWYRESEISADRAALLVTGDYQAFESLMIRLMRYSNGGSAEGGSIAELFQTHPSFERRVLLAREFYGSEEYRTARAKIELAAASAALASICAHCGAMTPRTEAFCPRCGRSRR